MKWDGYRVLAGQWGDGRVAVGSRNGSDLSRAFPEIEDAVARLPDDTAVDGGCDLGRALPQGVSGGAAPIDET